MHDYDYKSDSFDIFKSPFFNNEDNKHIKNKDAKYLNPNQISSKQTLPSDGHAAFTSKELEINPIEIQKTAHEISEIAASNFPPKIVHKPIEYKKGEQPTRDVIPTEKKRLGKGQFGSVHQHGTNAGLAVKKSYEPIVHEYEIGNKLDHPNIVKVHQLHIKAYPERETESGVITEKKYKMTMDKIEGKTLHSLMKNQQKISPSQARKLLSQAQNCCLYLFNQQVTWADLNTGNIFVAHPDNRLVLTDFAYWQEGGDAKTRAKQLLLGSMEIAQNIVKSLSAIENEEIHQAGLRIIIPEELLGITPPAYLDLNFVQVDSHESSWMKPILDKIDNMPENEIETFLKSYFDHVIKALEGNLPKDIAKGSLATSVLGLAQERVAILKTEAEPVPTEAGELKKCIETYFPNIDRLPNYQRLLDIIRSKSEDFRTWSKMTPFSLNVLLKIVAETIGAECDVHSLYMFRRDMKKSRGLI